MNLTFLLSRPHPSINTQLCYSVIGAEGQGAWLSDLERHGVRDICHTEAGRGWRLWLSVAVGGGRTRADQRPSHQAIVQERYQIVTSLFACEQHWEVI